MRKVWGVAFGIVALLFAVAVALQMLVMLTERSVYRDDPAGWIYFLITATVYAIGAAGCFGHDRHSERPVARGRRVGRRGL